MTTTEPDGLRQAVERLAEYERAWLWNEATDDTLAGWGYHMGQMLYRLPRDSQTEDMQESIDAMLADLKDAYALLAAHAPEADGATAGKREAAPCGRSEVHDPHSMPCDSGCQPDWHHDSCAIYGTCPGLICNGLPATPPADDASGGRA